MRTVAEPVEGREVRVEPADDPGVTVNGVPATLDAVQKADVRVDLAARGTRSFVVEHVLGPLGLVGVTAAAVTGVRSSWAFERPEHRFCYSRDLAPRHVVGDPGGFPNPALAAALADADVREVGETTRATVSEPVRLEAGGGDLVLRGREFGDGTLFDVSFGDASTTTEVDPVEGADPDVVEAVTNARTPFLAPGDDEAVTHAVADLVSDVCVVGGLTDVVVAGNLGDAYHALTVGVARRAHERGVVVREE